MILQEFYKQYFGIQETSYELCSNISSVQKIIKKELSKSFMNSGRNISGKFNTNNSFTATRILGPIIEPRLLSMSDMYLYGKIIRISDKATLINVKTKPHLTYFISIIGFLTIGMIIPFQSNHLDFKMILIGMFFIFISFCLGVIVKFSRKWLISSFEKIINPIRIEYNEQINYTN